MLSSCVKNILECPPKSSLVLAEQVAVVIAAVALVVTAVALITLFAPVIGVGLLGAAFSSTVALIIAGSAFLTALVLTTGAFGLFLLQPTEAEPDSPPSTPPESPRPPIQLPPPSPLTQSQLNPALEVVNDEVSFFVKRLTSAIDSIQDGADYAPQNVGLVKANIEIRQHFITFSFAPIKAGTRTTWINEMKYNARTKIVDVRVTNKEQINPVDAAVLKQTLMRLRPDLLDVKLIA